MAKLLDPGFNANPEIWEDYRKKTLDKLLGSGLLDKKVAVNFQGKRLMLTPPSVKDNWARVLELMSPMPVQNPIYEQDSGLGGIGGVLAGIGSILGAF